MDRHNAAMGQYTTVAKQTTHGPVKWRGPARRTAGETRGATQTAATA